MPEGRSRIVATAVGVVILLAALGALVAFVKFHKRSAVSQTGLGTRFKTGQIVINPQFDAAQNFSEGLAAVRIGDDTTGKWGFIDEGGALVINPQFDLAASFIDGLAIVRIGDSKSGKWGFIDKSGKFVISPQFSEVDIFVNNLAAVKVGDTNGKWGFINKTGNFVINPQDGYLSD